MAGFDERKLYLGPRLRVLRRELGINQTRMAEELGISPSYLNHLERNQRPFTAQMLLRLSNTYDLDVREFVAGADEASAHDLQEIFADRLLQDISIPRHEVRELTENHPSVAEAIVRLHRALGDLRRMPDYIEQFGATGSAGAISPMDWLRSTIEQQHNHFPALDAAAEAVAAEIGEGPEALLAGIPARLQSKRGISVRILPQSVLVGALRHYDFHRRWLMLSESLSLSSRLFALAYQLAVEEFSPEIEQIVAACAPPDAETSSLFKIALINYAAAAVMMPYRLFATAAEECRYELSILQPRFGASLEQVAHRLCTLDRPGQKGVPFFLLKVDAAGNVVKRLGLDNAPLPRTGGGCPKWNVQRALRDPARPVVDWIEHANDRRYLSVAVATHATHDGPSAVIVLGCQEKHAARTVYNERTNIKDSKAVGIACNICTRIDCRDRSLPPVTRALDLRTYQRASAPLPFRVT